MAEEEVKINVRATADTQALAATQAKIKELYELAARYEAKGGMETAAKSVRSEARDLEKDVARYKREQHAAEKDITRERREQASFSRAGEAQQQQTERVLFGSGRGLARGAVGGTAAAGLGFGLQEALTEYTERQGIALRAAAQRTLDERGLAIAGSWRGSSSQTLAQVHGLDDDIARQRANRPELERKANAGTMQGALSGAGAGAGIGAGVGASIGSIVPGIGTVAGAGIGSGIGVLVGGAAGAYRGHAAGEREKDEDSKMLELKQKRRGELEALGKRQVREEDGQIAMDLARHRAERTMSGSRAAIVDQQKQQFLNRYRELRGMNLSDSQAAGTATLEAQTAMRERQAHAGAGLVTAHSSAGDIASAARWGGATTPGMAEVVAELKGIHGTAKKNSDAAERIDQSVK